MPIKHASVSANFKRLMASVCTIALLSPISFSQSAVASELAELEESDKESSQSGYLDEVSEHPGLTRFENGVTRDEARQPAFDEINPAASSGTASADEGTEVGGILQTDTTWTKSGSPYRITSTVQIPQGLTLEVEPGVSIYNMSDTYAPMFLIHGRLKISGAPEQEVNIDLGGTRGTLIGAQGSTGGDVTVSHADIHNGYTLVSTAGTLSAFSLLDSNIMNVHGESVINQRMASIQRNRFTFSGGFVISLGRVYPADRQILDNRFQGESTSRAWIRGYSGDVEVHENFFDQNSGIALSVELATTPVRMNAERNYWGTTDATQIQSRILDKNDNISLPTVIPFEPVLTTPSPRIPVGILYSLGVSLYGDRCVSCELHVEPGAFRPSATTTTYQWLRGGEPIPGATDPSYFVTDADADHYISVEVTGYRDRFESLTVTSDGVRIPTPHNLEVASEAGPYLIGDPFVGNTLTAGWDRSSFIPEADRVLYQWYRDGEVIEGATSPDYELLQSDLGHTVSVETVAQRARYRTFTVSDFGGYTVTMGRLVTSKALALEGTGEVGSRLTATRFETNDFSPMADNVSYVWIRIDDRGNGSSIWGANSDTYTPTVDDIGYKVTVGITATKSDYEDYSLGSRVIRIRQADPIVLKTSRFHGPSRYGTNRAVNAFTAVQGNPVFIASGANYPDALSVGPAVRMLEGALFLTAPQQMEHATLVAIKNLQPSAVYIVGGTGAVSASVESALKRETGKKPVRVSGANRYETSKAIYDTFFAKHNPSRVFIATGRDYPDALSAASAAGALSAPVLLVDGTAARSLPNPLVAQLQNGGTQTVLIAGGTGVVNTSIESSLKRQFPSVHRLAGPNRYATNLKISQYLDSLEAADPVESIWVATGTNFPDALSAAAPAGTPRSRLVLSNGACIPSPVVSGWIKSPSSRVSNLFLVGGTAVLGKSVESLRQC